MDYLESNGVSKEDIYDNMTKIKRFVRAKEDEGLTFAIPWRALPTAERWRKADSLHFVADRNLPKTPSPSGTAFQNLRFEISLLLYIGHLAESPDGTDIYPKTLEDGVADSRTLLCRSIWLNPVLSPFRMHVRASYQSQTSFRLERFVVPSDESV